MDFRREEITCMTCKHFPCFPHDKKAEHTGHLDVDYCILHTRKFPCETYDIGVKWEPNKLLRGYQKKRNENEDWGKSIF